MATPMNLANNNFLKKETETKLAELKRVLPVLLLAPYTRIIFLAGSVAAGNPKSESDIDLIVVAKNGRVWLNKFFMEILTRTVRIKRVPGDRAGKICFNVFLSHKNPLLPHRDLIAAECYRNLKPVWCERKNDLEKFWQENFWIKKFCGADPVQEKILDEPPKKVLVPKKIMELFLTVTGLGIVLEKISFTLQSKHLKNKLAQSGASQNSADCDFFLESNLIAYHFPVSNHALELRKHKEKLASLTAVEKTPEKSL